MLIQSISETKLDIIGDIHGEITALENLLGHLGYDEKGNHPENRTLVLLVIWLTAVKTHGCI